MMNAPRSGAKWKVAIVGGGVGGLVAACFLARDGHEVTVLERKLSCREQSLEQGQGIHLSINATRCIDTLGMRDEFDRFADSSNRTLFKRYADGSLIHEASFKDRHSFVHRSDLLSLFYQHAVRAGAQVIGDDTFDQIGEGDNSVELRLLSGKSLRVDLVIGADGINSRVRQYIPTAKDIRPEVGGDTTFLVDLPKSYLNENPSTSHLFEEGKVPFHFWWGPERCIIGWTMKKHDSYHLQFVDFNKASSGDIRDAGESDNLVTSFSNMLALRQRWSDFDNGVRRMLNGTERCIKWKMAVLPDLPTWHSPKGRIILIGDAAHAFKPYAGQGAATAIEDATVLATLIASTNPSNSCVEIAEAYEHLRMPRIKAIRAIIEPNASVFSMPDGEAQRQRDARLRTSAKQASEVESKSDHHRTALESENTELKRDAEPKSDFDRTAWTSQNTEQWVKDYDGLAEARSFAISRWSSSGKSSSL